MNRARILTIGGVLVLVGVGLTVLVAARGPGDKGSDGPPLKSLSDNKLVCIGEVDTEDRYVAIYPKNFPQPSRVTKVLVKEGAKVKKDQPLLEFDVELLDLKVQEAEDGIAEAKFLQQKAEAAVQMHKVEMDFQEKTWRAKQKELETRQNEVKEARRLLEVKLASQYQVDAAEAAVRAAELNLEAARIKLNGLMEDVPNYLVNQAKANIKRLETMKETAVKARDQVACPAPADGRIIRSFVSDGQTFHPASREPAFWFLKDGPLMVRAEVIQEFARRVTMGKAAKIEDEADSSQVWHGRVTKIGDQFLPKRHAGGSPFDVMPVSDDKVIDCHVSIDLAPGEVGPKFGQKVRITLE
jgi:multidrug efflux pump subunit AcrA (membrane-fusion protein)